VVAEEAVHRHIELCIVVPFTGIEGSADDQVQGNRPVAEFQHLGQIAVIVAEGKIFILEQAIPWPDRRIDEGAVHSRDLGGKGGKIALQHPAAALQALDQGKPEINQTNGGNENPVIQQGAVVRPAEALFSQGRTDNRGHLMAFLPSLMCCSAVPRWL